MSGSNKKYERETLSSHRADDLHLSSFFLFFFFRLLLFTVFMHAREDGSWEHLRRSAPVSMLNVQ